MTRKTGGPGSHPSPSSAGDRVPAQPQELGALATPPSGWRVANAERITLSDAAQGSIASIDRRDTDLDTRWILTDSPSPPLVTINQGGNLSRQGEQE